MLPWITINNRPSTHFFNQEMAFFFARSSKKDPSQRAPFSRPPLKPVKPHTGNFVVSKVQQDIAAFQKRLESAREARSKQKTF
jgi:hypothetical protein